MPMTRTSGQSPLVRADTSAARQQSADPPSVRQRSFDELGVPLSEATFCVLDFETTGGNPATCAITEIGAVKVRGGEVIGTFQTMVNPGQAIPPTVTMLTGITDQSVARAPEIRSVLPTFLEFVGGAVIVGHNVRFDMGFLQAAIRRHGGPLLGNQRLDTLALARRLLVDETPTFKLGELARRLRLPHQPNHRALDDAWATVDLLHYLIERASSWGVTGVDDLVALPTVAGHPQWKKLSLTTSLPRKPGVYQFLDAAGTILYVGKATDLRARVRSYFSSDRRQKVAQLLRETDRITHQVCGNPLEAEVIELRLILEHQPRFNRRGRRQRRPAWVRLTTAERFPRLSAVSGNDGAGVYLGPLGSRKEAAEVIEAIQTALPIRRCSTRIRKHGPPPADAPCTAAQLGVAMCPCSGALSDAEYRVVVDQVARALSGEPELVLGPLEQRMHDLSAAQRFEDAAAMRDRGDAFSRALQRQRKARLLDDVDRLVVKTARGERVEVGSGDAAIVPATLDEALCVASWLDRHANDLDVIELDGNLTPPLAGLPNFTPLRPDSSSPRAGRGAS